MNNSSLAKIIILDRDGVINHDSDDYIKSPEEWIALPGSLAAMAALTQAGYIITIATNQSGVARGLYTEETLAQIHQKMRNAVSQAGGQVDSIFYCPHGPADHCECRKPKPGLLRQIADHYAISLQDVYYVGDKFSDIQAAQAIGCLPVLVKSGYGMETLKKIPPLLTIPIYDDLAAVVEKLLHEGEL